MNCEQLLAYLSDYIDGELDETRCRDIHAHLDGCDHCRKYITSLKACVEAARSLDRQTVPDDICRRIMEKLKRECQGNH